MIKITIALVFICFNLLKVEANKNEIDSLQIAGLCKVWGFMKYYHPDIAKNKIDWDRVLIDNYSEFTEDNSFESYNKKIINFINTVSKNKFKKKVNEEQFKVIIENRIENLENFRFLTDTIKYSNRISFSWINDSIFSLETKEELCKILINYKPIKHKNLKGRIVVKHKENEFKELDSITEPYRILSLFRYWNIINYFSPYRHLSDNNWNDILVKSINNFIEAKDYESYINQLILLSTKINDSHGFYRYTDYKYKQPNNKTDNITKKKNGYIPYNFKLINNSIVVSKILTDSTLLCVGDTVIDINNTNLKLLKNKRSFSTVQSANHYYETTLSNYYDTAFNLITIKNQDTIVFYENKSVSGKTKVDSRYRKEPYYYSINDNVGYIELTQIKFSQLKKAWKEFRHKDQIIFDLRGYPETIAWLALPHLLSNKPKRVAKYYYPNKNYSGTFIKNEKDLTYRFWFVKPFVLFKRRYEDKNYIVLINNETISQSETVCMMFKAYANNLTFIGTPTEGANGDISSIYLPGSIYFNFSSLDWQFPDGTQLQRNGIIPDIYVKTNIEDIKLEKDAILGSAIKYSSDGIKKN